MDDLIYRNNSIAEENLDPHAHPARNKFGEWSEQMNARTTLGFKEDENLSEEERERRLKAIDKVLDQDLKRDKK